MQNEKIKQYVDLLLKWNEKINLIGKSTVEDIYNRHILDSTQILDCLTEDEINNCVFADFGTGAGIPGIILSLSGVKTIHLLEKSFRKCEFLEEAKKISSNKIFIHNKNILEITNLKFDIILSRALAPLDELLTIVKPFLQKDTKCIFSKGRKLNEELEIAKKSWNFDYTIKKSKTSDEGSLIIITNIFHLHNHID